VKKKKKVMRGEHKLEELTKGGVGREVNVPKQMGRSSIRTAKVPRMKHRHRIRTGRKERLQQKKGGGPLVLRFGQGMGWGDKEKVMN